MKSTKIKTVVAVYGSSSKGKSSTIKEFAKELLSAYTSYTVIRGTATIPIAGDFDVILDINGIIVGIESMGDPNTNLQNRLIDLADNFHCDIIICSTRTKGETVYAVNSLQAKGFQTIWTSPYQIDNPATHGFANNLKGKNILSLLQGLGII